MPEGKSGEMIPPRPPKFRPYVQTREAAAPHAFKIAIEEQRMPVHTHRFVEEYDDMVAFGFSREVDEKSLMYYLQKFSDDELVKVLVPRLSDGEINDLFALVSEMMRKHLSDDEYHRLFLKDEGHHHHGESSDE